MEKCFNYSFHFIVSQVTLPAHFYTLKANVICIFFCCKKRTLAIEMHYSALWGTRWGSWLGHCATSRKVAGSIPGKVIALILPTATCPCVRLNL